MDPDIEPKDLPWQMAWRGLDGPIATIPPGQSRALRLVEFDVIAAGLLLGHKANGYPFQFPSTDGAHGVYGRLNINHMRDLPVRSLHAVAET
ncbi:MAG: hypothetical protein WD402_08670, partial [Chloroflexota bacterium]